MSLDLESLLRDWPFVPGQVTVRKVEGDDGKQKLQLRLDLGVLQMEMDGRPDGLRPMDCESLFISYKALAKSFAEQNDASAGFNFKLDAEDCIKLQQEAVQYYHRYLALFQLGDWGRVIRDTQRNIDLFDFVQQHVTDVHLAMMFQQFRPYVLMMRSRAKAQEALTHQDYDKATREVEIGIEEIKRFLDQHYPPEAVEQNHELRFLENWKMEIEKQTPLTERDKLEQALTAAIEREDYEAAALLRDSLKQFPD